MTSIILLAYLVIGLLAFFNKPHYLKTAFIITLILSEIWFTHHASDQLNINW